MNKRFILTPIAAITLALGTSIAAAQPTPSGSTSTTSRGSDTTSTQGSSAGTSGSSATPSASSGPRGASAASGTQGSRGASSPRDSREDWERTHRASKIIGMDVVNRQGEKVGDVEDIVLDRNGNVAYAVVSTGGFLGIGDKLHAVPWKSLQTNTGSDNYVLDVDKEKLRNAPGFDQANFPDVNDPKWSSENRKHFPTASSNAAGSAGRGGTATSDVGATTSRSSRSGTAAGAASTGSGSPDSATTGTKPYGADVDKDRMKDEKSGTGTAK